MFQSFFLRMRAVYLHNQLFPPHRFPFLPWRRFNPLTSKERDVYEMSNW